MCVLSMVMDYYRPMVPQKFDVLDPAATEKLIQDIKDAVAAATKVDVLTKQADCVDPEKAKLMERVAELEKKIAKLKKSKRKTKKK